MLNPMNCIEEMILYKIIIKLKLKVNLKLWEWLV